MMQTEFKRTNKGVTVTFKNMTQGESLALCHALSKHATTPSPVCLDLLLSLKYTIQRRGVEEYELYESLQS